jgi:hypothetical protein
MTDFPFDADFYLFHFLLDNIYAVCAWMPLNSTARRLFLRCGNYSSANLYRSPVKITCSFRHSDCCSMTIKIDCRGDSRFGTPLNCSISRTISQVIDQSGHPNKAKQHRRVLFISIRLFSKTMLSSTDLAIADTSKSQFIIPLVQTDDTCLIRAFPWYTGVPLEANRTNYLIDNLKEAAHPDQLLKLILVC